jgi:hypothetical protein
MQPPQKETQSHQIAFCIDVLSPELFVFVFVYLPTDLSLTDNFHKFELKIRLQTSRKQKTKQ